MKYESLHSHTTTSDGKMGYKKLLDTCATYNVGTIAFTDHDSLPNQKQLKELNDLKDHKTKWIMGIEMSSGLPKGVEGTRGMYHIAGLFVDPLNKGLLSHCAEVRERKIDDVKVLVKNLQEYGFQITFNDVLKEVTGPSMGRPHIVSALQKKEKNQKIIKETLRKMGEDAKHDSALKDTYDRMIIRGPDQYPYVLFLRRDAYIPGIYEKGGEMVSQEEVVRLIREAGGLAILAHWFFTRERVTLKVIEELFKEDRLDGAEVVYACDVPEWRKEIIKSMKDINQLCTKAGVIKSGGADLHDLEDIEIFTEETKEDFAEKTVGLAEQMVKKAKPNLEWSNL